MGSGMLTCFLHQPVRLREFSFLEIGTGGPYHDALQYQADALFWKEQLPICLDQLVNHCSDCTNNWQVRLAVTGFTLDWLAQWAPTTVPWLQKWRNTYQIPVFSLPYLPSCLAWFAPDAIAQPIGPVGQSTGKAFVQPQQPDQPMGSVFNMFRQEFTSTGFPMHLSEKLSRLGWKAVEPLLQSWPTDWQIKPSWFSNQLQQSALDAWFELFPQIEQMNDLQLYGEWYRLQALELFFDMRTEVGDATNAKAFAHYISFMNSLSDLKLRLG